jgi:hypothetical protein
VSRREKSRAGPPGVSLESKGSERNLPENELEIELEAVRPPGSDAFVAVVAGERSTELVRALSALPAGSIALYEIRDVVAGAPAPERLARVSLAGLVTEAEFLAAIPREVRPGAELLLARLARLDPGVERAIGPNAIEWGCDGRPLCSIAVAGGGLEGALASSRRPEPIRDRASAETFLDQVVGEHIAHLAVETGAGRLGTGREPLLTPEEIAAFHD